MWATRKAEATLLQAAKGVSGAKGNEAGQVEGLWNSYCFAIDLGHRERETG